MQSSRRVASEREMARVVGVDPTEFTGLRCLERPQHRRLSAELDLRGRQSIGVKRPVRDRDTKPPEDIGVHRHDVDRPVGRDCERRLRHITGGKLPHRRPHTVGAYDLTPEGLRTTQLPPQVQHRRVAVRVVP
ncbi:MAG: hypothetical protein ACK55I_33100, partial [bacterium]